MIYIRYCGTETKHVYSQLRVLIWSIGCPSKTKGWDSGWLVSQAEQRDWDVCFMDIGSYWHHKDPKVTVWMWLITGKYTDVIASNSSHV